MKDIDCHGAFADIGNLSFLSVKERQNCEGYKESNTIAEDSAKDSFWNALVEGRVVVASVKDFVGIHASQWATYKTYQN